MRNSLTRLSVIAVLASAFAVPQLQAAEYPAPLRALEDAIESSTEAVLLPVSVPGTLSFRDCVEPCKLRSLEVSAEAAFFVGDTPVSLADFNAYLRNAGPQFLMVFRKAGQNSVTRIHVPGQFTLDRQGQPNQARPARPSR
jgi:hypothetical protein